MIQASVFEPMIFYSQSRHATRLYRTSIFMSSETFPTSHQR